MTAAVAIICKTPRAGASKTRMIPILGAQTAAALAAAFLQDIAGVIVEAGKIAPCSGFAIYAPAGSEDVLRSYLPPDFGLICQQDASLGTVLLRAFEELGARGFTEIVLVNADSPTLPASTLVDAIDALKRSGDRVVLGPAIDGGYYLIGLKRPHAHLFANVPWSTADVLARTRERAAEIALPVEELQTWYDVDDAQSLDMLRAELAGAPLPFATETSAASAATATRALLALEQGRPS